MNHHSHFLHRADEQLRTSTRCLCLLALSRVLNGQLVSLPQWNGSRNRELQGSSHLSPASAPASAPNQVIFSGFRWETVMCKTQD